MLDPITALDVIDDAISLAGTLWKVFKALCDYVEEVKNAPKHSDQLHEELYAISKIIKNLKTTVAESPTRRSGTVILQDLVSTFEEMLKEMEMKISLSAKTVSVKRLKWPFSLKENMEYLERIERFKGTLHLALSVYQTYSAL
jgi:hypothetical protein